MQRTDASLESFSTGDSTHESTLGGSNAQRKLALFVSVGPLFYLIIRVCVCVCVCVFVCAPFEGTVFWLVLKGSQKDTTHFVALLF